MNEIPNIITERVDDIPLLIEQMQRMGLPTLLDNHFPPHGNWTGLSLGWGSTIWLSSMLSRGDHRMVHVEPWVAKRLWTLGFTTGQAVMRVDFTDDRLEIVLRRLSEDTRWAAFASALNQHTVRVYDLSTARVHVDSPSASVYATVSAGGLFSVAPAGTRGRTCLRARWCRPSWTRWGCRWPRMWSRVSEPMTRCICPALRGCRRVWAGTGCYTWVTARWRRVTRERGSPPPVIFTCAPCLRCSWTRASSTRPLKRFAMANMSSVRSFEKAQRVNRK